MLKRNAENSNQNSRRRNDDEDGDNMADHDQEGSRLNDRQVEEIRSRGGTATGVLVDTSGHMTMFNTSGGNQASSIKAPNMSIERTFNN